MNSHGPRMAHEGEIETGRISVSGSISDALPPCVSVRCERTVRIILERVYRRKDPELDDDDERCEISGVRMRKYVLVLARVFRGLERPSTRSRRHLGIVSRRRWRRRHGRARAEIIIPVSNLRDGGDP